MRGEYGFVVEGRPLFPMFRDRTHVAVAPVEVVAGLPLQIGVDFGLDCTATESMNLSAPVFSLRTSWAVSVLGSAAASRRCSR